MKHNINTDCVYNILNALARIRGIERINHFADGGTVAQWRGKCQVQVDKKKKNNKRACRMKAIE